MKIVLPLMLFMLVHLVVLAQDYKITAELKQLYQNEQYDRIISAHSNKAESYTAKAIYYVGLAYYMKEDDENCLKYMDMSIKKESHNADPHYIKGKTLQYLSQHVKAIESINTALKLNPKNGEFYSTLADSYFELGEFDKALTAYTTATKYENAPNRSYIMIPQVYSALGNEDAALSAFYTALSKLPKGESSYITVLYNIGLYESIKGKYDKSEFAFKELLELDPNDYQSNAKLIQVYFARKEYEKATPLKKKLYAAHSKGILQDNLKDMFCFDQFRWNNKLIQVFEKYAEPEGKVYYKHIFYVLDEDGEIELSVQTENSPISIEQGGAKYLVGMRKGSGHSTFNVGFNQNPDYDKLKQTVIDILEGKIKPVASSQLGK